MKKFLLMALLLLCAPWVLAQSCPPYTQGMYFGSSNGAFPVERFGTGTISMDGDSINVDVTMEEARRVFSGSVIQRVAFFAGTDAVPMPMISGRPDFLNFPIFVDDLFSQGLLTYHLELPLTQAGNPKCGEMVRISLLVTLASSSGVVRETWLWGSGFAPVVNSLYRWHDWYRCCPNGTCGWITSVMETYATEFGEPPSKAIASAILEPADGGAFLTIEGRAEPKPNRPNLTWRINGVWVYQGTAPPPTNVLGGPAISAYTNVFDAPPIEESFNELPRKVVVNLLLPAGVTSSCQQAVSFSAFASMVLVDEQGSNTGEDGRNPWMVGSNPMTDTGQGTTPYWFTFGGCCAASTGCTTSTQQFVLQSKYASAPDDQIPWPISEDTQLCKSSWYKLLSAKGGNPNFLPLAKQWITSQLNLAKGTSSSQATDAAMLEADQLLESCRSLTTSQKLEAARVTETLASYNKGELGAAACPVP